jgi:hypothetical protein
VRRALTRIRNFTWRVSVAEIVQAHRLLEMFEAVQVRLRQAVDLSFGSPVLTDQVVTEPVAPYG